MIKFKRENILNSSKKLTTFLTLSIFLVGITINNIGNTISIPCSSLKLPLRHKASVSTSTEYIPLESNEINASKISGPTSEVNSVSSINKSPSLKPYEFKDGILANDTTNQTAISDSSNNNFSNDAALSNIINNTKTVESSSLKLCDVFKNDLFLGDSITKGLASYKFLDDANVCAKIGNTVNQVRDMAASVSMSNPEKIFILCGVNNVDVNANRNIFSDNYLQLIHTVKNKFPSSTVYVQSILPVSPVAEQNTPYLRNSCINEYNKIIMDIAKKENLAYIDLKPILTSSNKNLYENDGLHYKADFYPLWLNYLKNNY